MDVVAMLEKLQLLAENAGTPEEAENALARANSLARKYHLELRTSADYQAEDPLVTRPSDVVIGGAKQPRYKWTLAWIVAKAHGCVPWSTERYAVAVHTTDLDLERAVYDAWPGHKHRGTATVEDLEDGPWLVLEGLYANPLQTWEVKSAAHAGGGSPRGVEHEPELPSYRVSRLEYEIVREKRLVMIGRGQIADAAIYVYRVLLASVDKNARQIAKGQGKTALNSARLGCVAGLRNRMAKEDSAALQAAADEGEPGMSTAMVLIEAVEESTRFLSDSYGSTPFGVAKPSGAVIDNDAWSAGFESADDIELPDPNGRRAALGHGRVLGSKQP
jgi:hypothetical protein